MHFISLINSVHVEESNFIQHKQISMTSCNSRGWTFLDTNNGGFLNLCDILRSWVLIFWIILAQINKNRGDKRAYSYLRTRALIFILFFLYGTCISHAHLAVQMSDDWLTLNRRASFFLFLFLFSVLFYIFVSCILKKWHKSFYFFFYYSKCRRKFYEYCFFVIKIYYCHFFLGFFLNMIAFFIRLKLYPFLKFLLF